MVTFKIFLFFRLRSQGFSNNLETYGLISGLWTSTFALGAFIGPSLGGILYDTIGFKNATMVVVTLNAFVVSSRINLKNRKKKKNIEILNIDRWIDSQGILVAVFISCRKHRQPYKQIPNDSEKTLIKENGNTSHLSGKSGGKPGMSNGVLIERPPGMSGLIACNSYKNRHGTWHKKESGAVLIGPYSTSYGSLESRGGFLASVA